MADVKWSALSAAGAAAAADYLVGLQSGSAVKYTAAQLKTFCNTAPTFAAGTATAGTWVYFTAGTLLTAPVAGALELDATNFYGTTEASNRGVLPVEHFIIANAIRTFTSNTSAQALFNAPANGALTLGLGTYLFELLFTLTGMSATSGNGKFSLAGAATIGNFMAIIAGMDVAADGLAGFNGYYTAAAASGVLRVTSAGTGTGLAVQAKGSFVVTGAGTVIPSFALDTAAAAVVSVGSYFTCRRVGSGSVASVGNWS